MSFDRKQVPAWRPGYRFQYEPAQKAMSCYTPRA